MSWTIYKQPKAPDNPPGNLQYLQRLAQPFPRHKIDRTAFQAAAATWDGVDLSHRKYGDGSHYAELRTKSDGDPQTWQRMSKLPQHREVHKGRYTEPPPREYRNTHTLPPLNNPRYTTLAQPSPGKRRPKAQLESHAAPPIERWRKDEWDGAMKKYVYNRVTSRYHPLSIFLLDQMYHLYSFSRRAEERIHAYVARVTADPSQYNIEKHKETERAYRERLERIERLEMEKMKRIESMRHTQRHKHFEETCEMRRKTREIEQRAKRRAPLGKSATSPSPTRHSEADNEEGKHAEEEEKKEDPAKPVPIAG